MFPIDKTTKIWIYILTYLRNKGVNMFFTRLVKKGFKIFFEIWLWLNVVACSAFGGIIANFLYTYRGPFFLRHTFRNLSIHPVLGVLLGLAIGIFSSVLIGGFVVHLLKLDDRKG
jgi:hypothetical protein